MPIIIRCHSCGFILYQGNELKSIDEVLREWGYRCPACMSPLSTLPLGMKVAARVTPKYLVSEDTKNRGGSS
jgi:uncharacterized protein with PIN domain